MDTLDLTRVASGMLDLIKTGHNGSVLSGAQNAVVERGDNNHWTIHSSRERSHLVYCNIFVPGYKNEDQGCDLSKAIIPRFFIHHQLH